MTATGAASFGVTEDGVLDFSVTNDTFLNGRNSNHLQLAGVSVTVDPTPLGSDIFRFSALGDGIGLDSGPLEQSPLVVSVLPTAFRVYSPDLSQFGMLADIVAQVTDLGKVDFPPNNPPYASGIGTTTLRAQGLPVIVDVTALSSWPQFFLTSSPTLLPGFLTVFNGGNAEFLLKPDSSVDLLPSESGYATAAGSILVLSGYSVTIDATALGTLTGSFALNPRALGAGFDPGASFSTSTATTLNVLPSSFVFSAAGFPTFHFSVGRDGLFDYAPDMDNEVLGRGTSQLILGNTRANSPVMPVDSATGATPVTLTFDNVTKIGQTNLTITSTGPNPPAGFSLGSPAVFYNIITTATFTGNINICINFAGVSFQGDPLLMHFEGGTWVQVTNATVNGTTICGSVNSLSPFAVMQAADLPPIANAGSPQTVACTSAAGAAVTLNGTASHDPDGQAITYAWSGPFGNATGATPIVNLPLGSSTITLVVNDGHFNSAPARVTDTVTIAVSGFQPPMAALAPSGSAVPLPGNAFQLGRTVPLKLQLSCGANLISAGVAPPQIVALVRNGDALNLTTIDPDAGQANDNGLLFRASNGQWVYNLSTAGLSSGTYTITVLMPDGRSYDAGFVLK